MYKLTKKAYTQVSTLCVDLFFRPQSGIPKVVCSYTVTKAVLSIVLWHSARGMEEQGSSSISFFVTPHCDSFNKLTQLLPSRTVKD